MSIYAFVILFCGINRYSLPPDPYCSSYLMDCVNQKQFTETQVEALVRCQRQYLLINNKTMGVCTNPALLGLNQYKPEGN